MAWFGAHPLRPALAAMALIVVLGAASCVTAPPRADRDWYPYLARTPHVEFGNDRFSVAPVSDWSYAGPEVTAQAYIEAGYALDQLRGVWFMLEPQPGSQLAAHTLLLFEFEDDRLLGITIEARRETHEDYSALAGLWNSYELAFIWASARDLLTRRAVMLDHDVFIYPVNITPVQNRALLTTLLQRTAELETQPRYYNTVFSNCTNELAKAAGFHWAPAYVFTGRSDEYLFRRGILPGDSFEQAHARSDMGAFINALNQAPPEGFDAALLGELRRRNR